MNQILQVNDKKRQLKPINAKKILITLIIFVIIASLGIGGYYVYINVINGNINLPIFIEIPKDTPEITITNVSGNKIKISVQSEVGISKLMYSVNNGGLQVIELIGKTIIEETIDVPIGENTIYVSVIDVNEKEIKRKEKIVIEGPKPEIELSVIGNNIKITVISEVELSEVKYNWNSDKEKVENMKTYENRELFEKQIEIPIGQNILTIVATDINGSKTEKTQEIKGVTKATTTTKVEGQYLHFTIKGKENIQKVEFTFNGQKFLMNTDTFGETNTVHYKVKLVEGKNYLTVTSTTQSGGMNTTSYEQEYTKR